MDYFKARLKTGGKTPEQILADYEGPGQIGKKPDANEVEALIKAFNGIDGIELIVMKSFNGNYVPASWKNEDDEKMMEFVYQAEQDPFFGTYIDEREEFIKDWKSDEYEPAGTLVFDSEDVEIIEELKKEKAN